MTLIRATLAASSLALLTAATATPAIARDLMVSVEQGARLHVVDEGTGPAVVIVPGWPLGAADWADIAHRLVTSGHRVIRIDERGFGGSASAPGPYSYDRFARDLDAVLTARRVRAATLVGHSMGGAVVAHYAATLGRGHDLRLVLVAAAGPAMVEGAGHGGVPKAVFDGIRDGVAKDRAGFIDGFASGFFAVPPDLARLAAFKREALAASPTATVEAIAAVAAADLTPELGAVRARTVIVHGIDDKIVPVSQAEWWAKAIRGATVVRVEGAGHGVYADNPDAVVAAVRDVER